MVDKKKRRAALYIRVSTLDQAEGGYSLEAQEQTLRKWCADHDVEIYHLYADRGISGKNMDRRPEIGQLMRDCRDNKFDTVVFWALSRFTRSVSDLYYIFEVFKQYGIEMFSYTESFDTNTPMGRAMMGVAGVFGQLERELASERISVALAVRAAQGKCTCGSVLGYVLVNGKFEVVKAEAEQILFYFESYLARKSLTEVAELARAKGFKGKRGKPPVPQSIRVTLTRAIYCGYNTFKGCIYKGTHEPIISVELYNKVQHTLKKQGKLCGRPLDCPIVTICK